MLLSVQILLWLLGLWMSYVVFRFVQAVRYGRYVVSNIEKLPGRKWHKVLGIVSEFRDMSESGLAVIRRNIQTYPRLYYWYFGPRIVHVVVHHPDTVKAILKTAEPKSVMYGIYRTLIPWLGDGLLTSGGAKWARHRRLLTPAFHFDILKPYNNINNQATDIVLEKLEKSAKIGEFFETFSLVSLCTLDVVLKCAFSYPEDVQRQGHPLVHLPPIFWLSSGGRKFRKCCDFVHGVAERIIKERRKTIGVDQNCNEPTKKKMLDFLDILLTARDEDGKGLTDREIRDEVDTFLFEGHDTTSSGISWMLYSMAENPDWQRRCQQELDDILQGRQSDEILWDDLPKLKVLTACLKEALRLHAPVPVIERITTKDMYLDGYFLAEGTPIDINIYGLMHNEAVWEAPMEFRPERFLSEDPKDSFAFVPFSAGPRNCIGQHFAMHEMKTVVARILKRFTLEPDPERPAKHKISIVMRTEKGMYLRATSRDTAGKAA